jgi:DNA primase
MLIPKNNLTKDNILSLITEEDIYRKYTNFKIIGKKFHSPFNKEKTPSCIVFPSNNYLYFKDFSSGKKGNCFSLVQQLEQISYQDSLLKIKNDFDLRINFNNSLKIREYIPKITNIQIRTISWTKKHLDYWKDYGISLNTLKYFNIVPISHYWINYNRFLVNFGFAYCFGNYKYKILQPEDNDWKWVSNTNIDIVQGLKQINKPEEIIVTSSLKDVACIYENLGLQAIAPNSENTMLSKKVIERLQTIKTTIWFNNDKPGIEAANKYKEFGFNIFIHDSDLPKDPSDIYKEGYDLDKVWKIKN